MAGIRNRKTVGAHLTRMLAIGCAGALLLSVQAVAASAEPTASRARPPGFARLLDTPDLSGSEPLSLAETFGVQRGPGAARQSSPSVLKSAGELLAESCGTPTLCIGVGDYYYHGSYLPLSAKWNGSSWTRVPVPVPTGLSDEASVRVTGVSCVGSAFCMAVGNINGDESITLSWNGTTWSYVSLPTIQYDPYLLSVACPSTSECMAVGEYSAPGGEAGLDVIWSSTSGWEQEQTAALTGGSESAFGGVACPNTGLCVVVGGVVNQGAESFEPLGEEDVLGNWGTETMPSGPAGYGAVALSVSCPGIQSCVAVGYAASFASERYESESYYWNGSVWKKLSTPQPGSAGNELLSVSCQPTTAVSCEAVGSQTDEPSASTQTTALSLQGTTWSRRPSPSPSQFQELDGVSCSSANACTAVGSAATNEAQEATGALLQSKSSTSQVIPVPTGLDFGPAAVDCVRASDCMMVGEADNGVASLAVSQLWNGHKWAVLPVPTDGASYSTLNAINCKSATDCVAVGEVSFGGAVSIWESAKARVDISEGGSDEGLVATWNGKDWSVTAILSDYDDESLYGVSCATSSSCVAVGTGNGVAISYLGSGSHWTLHDMHDVSGYDTPSAVACTSTSSCEAVGDGSGSEIAVAQHWNGSRWKLQSVPTSTSLIEGLGGIACPSANDCVAVGSVGPNVNETGNLVLLWNGKTWARQTVPAAATPQGLTSVSCISPSSCVAVAPSSTGGSVGGVILTLASGHWTATTPTAAKGTVALAGVSETSVNSAVAVGVSLQRLGYNQIRLVESKGVWSST